MSSDPLPWPWSKKANIIEEGVLFGRGGGIVQLYNDFVILPSNLVLFRTYDERTQENYREALLLRQLERPMLFDSYVAELDRIGFRNIRIPPPPAETVEYVVLMQKGSEHHAVVWPAGDPQTIPSELYSLYRSFREFLVQEFAKEHGLSWG